uniref:RRM domain-containing protein n=1 Tax=Panagrellus redivivus TaxID=6233 RepID=A0A7E4VDA2_PANRE
MPRKTTIDELLPSRYQKATRKLLHDVDALENDDSDDEAMDSAETAADEAKIRQIREQFVERWTTLPELWLEWIEDEIVNDAPTEYIDELFNKAFSHFRCPNLLARCIQWICEQNVPLEKYDQLIELFGRRPDMGSLLWENYIEMLAMSGTTNKEKVVKHYENLISFPNDALVSAYEQYNQLVDGKVDPKRLTHYQKCLESYKDLVNHQNDWGKWIQDIIGSKDVTFVLHSFEMLLARSPNDAEIWREYLAWLKTTNLQEILTVCHRACHLFVEDVFFWQDYLFQLERFNRPWETLSAVFEEGLSHYHRDCESSSALYRSAIYSRLRYVRKAATGDNAVDYAPVAELFNRAYIDLSERFGAPYFDAECDFRKNYAFFAFNCVGDVELGRKLWREILGSGVANQAKWWIDAVDVERRFGTVEHARNMLYKAVNSVFEEAVPLFDYFVQFERDEGDFEQVSKALKKVNDQLGRINAQQAKKAAQAAKQAKKPIAKAAPNAAPPAQAQAQPEKKRRRPSLSPTDFGSPAKRQALSPEPESSFPEVIIKDKDGFVIPSLPVRLSPRREAPMSPRSSKSPSPSPMSSAPNTASSLLAPVAKKPSPPLPSPASPSPSPPAEPTPQSSSPAQPPSGSDSAVPEVIDPGKTVFVSNLNFKVNEQQLAQFFPKHSAVRLVRKGTNGPSKGFGYIDFATKEDAQEALKRDRDMLNGRPIFISAYSPHDKGESAEFKYSTGIDRTKLFVKNLPKTCSNDQLKEAFAPFGGVVSARIVTQKNGKSKCCGYVDFESEAQTTRAINSQIEIDGRLIEVYISNPPKPKPADEAAALNGPARAAPKPKPKPATTPARGVAPALGARKQRIESFVPRVVATARKPRI